MAGIATSLLPSLILLALVFLPIGLVLGIVLYQKHLEKRTAKKSPLNEKVLHHAGMQARKKIDAISDDIMERLMQVMLIGPMTMLVILLPRVQWSRMRYGWIEWIVVAGAFLCVLWLARSIVLLRKERKAWQAGHLGELATAQALNKLAAHRCLVFHDLPTDRANIDHIVVTPNAVFAVETKWRSKGPGKSGAEVHYDGKVLRFPSHETDEPLHQVRGLSQWLSKYLHGETGQPVRVIPTVALPGWYVILDQGSTNADVKVINEKWQKTFLDIGGVEITQEQRTRIVNAISKKYPEMNI